MFGQREYCLSGSIIAAILVTGSFSVMALDPAVTMPPMEYSAVDANNVDLMSGIPKYSQKTVSIGPSESPLTHVVHYHQNGFDRNRMDDNFSGGFDFRENDDFDNLIQPVYLGEQSERFFVTGTTFSSLTGAGATLVDNQNGKFSYVKSDGTELVIDSGYFRRLFPAGVITQMKEPNGRTTKINYRSVVVNAKTISRIQSVVRSDGFMLKYSYASNSATSEVEVDSWIRLTKVTGVNLAKEYCAPLADICAFANEWPFVSFTRSNIGDGYALTIIDQGGGNTRYTMDSHSRLIAYKPKTSNNDVITYSLCARVAPHNCSTTTYDMSESGTPVISTVFVKDKVTDVTNDGQYWDYDYPPGSEYSRDYKSLSPTGSWKAATYYVFFNGKSPLAGLRLENGIRVEYGYLTYAGKPVREMMPEGGGRSFQYDSRWNLRLVQEQPKTDGAFPNISVFTAEYDSTCQHRVKCNKPNWTRDAKGNQTDYAYSTTHGGITSITSPAVNGIRPQKRYSYTQRTAWVKSSSGAYVQEAPIWLLAGESYCRTSAAVAGGPASGGGCAVSGDEVLTVYEYGANSGPNNLLLRGIAVTAEGQTLRTCYRYDDRGNKLSETKPKAGLSNCP